MLNQPNLFDERDLSDGIPQDINDEDESHYPDPERFDWPDEDEYPDDQYDIEPYRDEEDE